jgi:hypothetical protein
LTLQNSIAAAFGFLERDYGFVRKLDSMSPDAHVEYSKDPLSVDIWWGKGEIDVTFVISLQFSKDHHIFRPYVSRTFDLTQVALSIDPKALEPWRRQASEPAGYVTDPARADVYLKRCADLMRRHCIPLLSGDLAVLERLTTRRRAHA